MKTITLLSSPLGFAFCLAALVPAAAQDQEPAKTQRIASIEMKSGTLGELVDLLRRDTTQSILLPRAFRDLALPEVFLRNVDAVSALRAVDQLLPEILVDVITDGEGSAIVNIISDQVTAPPSPKICRVFKATSGERLKPEDLGLFMTNLREVSLITCMANAEAKGGIRPNKDFPTLKNHTSTGLLIVAGEEEEVLLIGQVIVGLGGEAVPLGKSAGAANGLRIEADTMTYDSKGNILKLQSGAPRAAPVTELPGRPDSSSELKAAIDQLREAAKRNERADETLQKRKEPDPIRPPTGK